MPINPSDFFPPQATWPFFEHSSQEKVSIDLKTRQAGSERAVEFSAPPPHHFIGFFDRMGVTSTSLALRRIAMRRQALDISPPLVITNGDARDQVADLFPGIDGLLGPTIKPYDGTVIFKRVKEIPQPGSPEPDVLWSIGIASRGKDKQIVFRALLQFLRSAGLIEYTGDVYGVFFVYRRTDLPHIFPPAPPPATTAPPQRPVLPGVPKPVKKEQQQTVAYHVRVAKAVWDSTNDRNLLTKLKTRAEDEREVAVGLVRHDLVKPDEKLARVLKQQAKKDPELREIMKRHNLPVD